MDFLQMKVVEITQPLPQSCLLFEETLSRQASCDFIAWAMGHVPVSASARWCYECKPVGFTKHCQAQFLCLSGF